MAYRRKRNTVTLSYGPESDYPGLEVEVRPMSVEVWLTLNGMKSAQPQTAGLTLGDALTSLEIFADHLVGWTLVDDDTGEPVPVKDALREDMVFLNHLAGDWMNGATEVSAPLEQSSSDGPSLGEVPLPMEPLSPSPQS